MKGRWGGPEAWDDTVDFNLCSLSQDELKMLKQVGCSSNPTGVSTNGNVNVLVKLECGLPNGRAALKYFNFLPFKDSTNAGSAPFTNSVNFDPSNLYDSLLYGLPFIATVIFYAIFTFMSFVFFMLVKQKTKRSRTKLNKMWQKLLWLDDI